MALRRSPVVMTLIGGGVLGNPVTIIWEAILRAFDEIQKLSHDLDVVVNGRDLVNRIGLPSTLQDVKARGWVVIRLGAKGLLSIDR